MVRVCGTTRRVWRTTRGEEAFIKCLDARRRTFLGVFASFVVLSEIGIARLLHDRRRWRRWRRRRVCRLARVDAGSSLSLSNEGSGALVGDDLEIVRATGVQEVWAIGGR